MNLRMTARTAQYISPTNISTTNISILCWKGHQKFKTGHTYAINISIPAYPKGKNQKVEVTQAFFGHFEKKIQGRSRKTQAIFSKSSSKFVKKFNNFPTENQFFLVLPSFGKFFRNCFTKLKQLKKKNLKEFQEKL